jgi:hypothetical protein
MTNIFSGLMLRGEQRPKSPSPNISAKGRIRCGEQAPEKLQWENARATRGICLEHRNLELPMTALFI